MLDDAIGHARTHRLVSLAPSVSNVSRGTLKKKWESLHTFEATNTLRECIYQLQSINITVGNGGTFIREVP